MFLLFAVMAIYAAALAACRPQATAVLPTALQTILASETPTPSDTVTPTLTATPQPTRTPTPEPTTTNTPEPSPTPDVIGAYVDLFKAKLSDYPKFTDEWGNERFDMSVVRNYPVLEIPAEFRGDSPEKLAKRQEFIRRVVLATISYIRSNIAFQVTTDSCLVPWSPSIHSEINKSFILTMIIKPEQNCTREKPPLQAVYGILIKQNRNDQPSLWDPVIIFQAINTPEGIVIVPSLTAANDVDSSYLDTKRRDTLADWYNWNKGAAGPIIDYPLNSEHQDYLIDSMKVYKALGLSIIMDKADFAVWLETGFPPKSVEESGSVIIGYLTYQLYYFQ